MPVRLSVPCSEEAVRSLRVGDAVLLSGRVYTGRDRFHKAIAEGVEPPFDFAGGALFHCGPVVTRGTDGAWHVVAAGPTTSSRENPYMPALVRTLGLRFVIGKGGMDAATAEAFRACGCVYLQAVGGAAALLARAVRRVADVRFLEEFGATEACWALEVVDLPAIVGMDAAGQSLFETVRTQSAERLAHLLASSVRPS